MSEPSFQLLNQLNMDLAVVVGAARQSLVKIQNGRRGSGAGTIIHPDGLIVTNAHVVGSRELNVTLWDGDSLRGQVVAVDRKIDLAAIVVEAKELPAAEMATRGKVQPGQWVVALGHPWGIEGAVTAGIIIAVGRPVEKLPYDGELIQAGLRLRPGHSGGPMLNYDGRLVGINTMISGPAVGLAVPVDTVKKFLKKALGSRMLKTI
jgi:serine protease Do